MSIFYHPPVGSIVRVDLNDGFRPPEMVKRRPAIVLSPPLEGREQLCTIVPLSTTRPKTIKPYHYFLELDPPLPAPYDEQAMWVKADIVLTVAFHRLSLLFRGRDETGRRLYDLRVLRPEQLSDIRRCVRSGLGFPD